MLDFLLDVYFAMISQSAVCLFILLKEIFDTFYVIVKSMTWVPGIGTSHKQV